VPLAAAALLNTPLPGAAEQAEQAAPGAAASTEASAEPEHAAPGAVAAASDLSWELGEAETHTEPLAAAYSILCGVLHGLLTTLDKMEQQQHSEQPGQQQPQSEQSAGQQTLPEAAEEAAQPRLVLDNALLSAALTAAAAGGPWLVQCVQQEAAALQLVVAAAAGGDAASQSAALRRLLGGPGRLPAAVEPLVWPPIPAQQGAGQQQWSDPLAAAVLLPPVAAPPAGLPPPTLLPRLPLPQQVLLLESLLPCCSPEVATGAVAVAQQACDAAAAAVAVAAGRQGPAPVHESSGQLWRFPTLSWAIPAAATALISSVPPAAALLWSQASKLASSAFLSSLLSSPPARLACLWQPSTCLQQMVFFV
jgi:hypothetical protein